MIDIEHLCPGCMHQRKYLSQSCPNCGYPNRQIHATGALPPLTILSGRYLLGCPVGKGGFGITYIAMDLPKEEIVAVKEFFPRNWPFAMRKATLYSLPVKIKLCTSVPA